MTQAKIRSKAILEIKQLTRLTELYATCRKKFVDLI